MQLEHNDDIIIMPMGTPCRKYNVLGRFAEMKRDNIVLCVIIILGIIHNKPKIIVLL